MTGEREDRAGQVQALKVGGMLVWLLMIGFTQTRNILETLSGGGGADGGGARRLGGQDGGGEEGRHGGGGWGAGGGRGAGGGGNEMVAVAVFLITMVINLKDHFLILHCFSG